MKKLLLLIVLTVGILSCSEEEEKSLLEQGDCDCTKNINIWQGAVVISSEQQQLKDSCEKDGLYLETKLENGNLQVESWDCIKL